MNTKDIGNLGEHIGIAELLRYGVQISRPLGDNSRYDLILDINNLLYTCQVKSSKTSTDCSVTFCLTSSQIHRGKGRTKYDVDCFLLVDTNKNKVFMTKNTLDKTAITIRYLPPKNNQKNVNLSEEFSVDKFIQSLK